LHEKTFCHLPSMILGLQHRCRQGLLATLCTIVIAIT
jgi:hypothetical protein